MPPEIETPLASPLASDINCSDKETKLHSRDDDGMSGMGAPPRKIQKTSPSPSQPHTATAQLPDTLAPTSRVVSPTERADDEETSSHGKDAAELAKTRDGNRCFLTGDCDPDIVQIIPLSPEARHRATGFIGLVRLLYDGEQFPPWIHLLLNRSVVQTQNNLLCLSKHMRDLWSKCFFALKPVAATDQEVTVQFHWLKHNTGITPDHYGLYDYDFAMQAVCDGDTHGWGPPQAARLPDGNLIETGQLFTIRAEPDQLPNTDLLQLQWYWKRMSAMIADSEVYFRFERRGYSGYSDSDQETDAATDQGSISSEGDSEESEKW
ncbi:hypothetical protein SEPCBS119000_003635 [Sporothrix epigloea]|uniref:HNH nuclease domain-containing protein n=1 Tax=Sporothrix epigloea TaxID=1892477 RepID=A0ABP0DMR0_9PEZI